MSRRKISLRSSLYIWTATLFDQEYAQSKYLQSLFKRTWLVYWISRCISISTNFQLLSLNEWNTLLTAKSLCPCASCLFRPFFVLNLPLWKMLERSLERNTVSLLQASTKTQILTSKPRHELLSECSFLWLKLWLWSHTAFAPRCVPVSSHIVCYCLHRFTEAGNSSGLSQRHAGLKQWKRFPPSEN